MHAGPDCSQSALIPWILASACRVLDAPAEGFMTDLLLVLATAAFFGLSWGYARLCEKL
jgi:hypothetical protein